MSNASTTTLRPEAAGVRIEGVNLSYGPTRVLKDVDLDIRPGEFFAFLGPSGCGKTTLLRLIAGFAQAQTGRVTVGGRDITGLPPWTRDVGMVFQSYALWPHMTVRGNVAFGLEQRRVGRADIRRRVDAALDIVGLKHLADRRPSQLSGGQQQRVALARTVAVEPNVLLLDEPLSNLDARMRVQVRRELLDMQRRLGLTTIFVTHDQEEANTMSDRIAVMQDGVVQQVGTPMELYDRPANLFVAGFLGTANILDGRAEAGSFVLGGGGRVPLAGNAPEGAKLMLRPEGAKLMFRPQVAALVPAGTPVPPGRVRLDGVARHREFLGATLRYGVDVGGTEVLVDVAHGGGEAPIAVGAPVGVDLDPAKAMVLRG